MSVKLIAVDVDGTLINSAGQITAETKAAIRRADQAGIKLVLGTGRCRVECRQLLQELPEIRYMINCSGASVYDLDQERELYVDGLPMSLIRQMSEAVSSMECLFELMADGEVLTDRERLSRLSTYHSPYYIDIIAASRTPVEMEQVLQSRQDPVAKLHLFFRSPEEQQRGRKLLEPFGLPILSSVAENLEINQPHVDKGLGLQKLADYLEIPLSETMAIGDNLNDLGMYRAAGYTVAMENACPEAKAMADYETTSCDEHGVAHVIDHVLRGTLEQLRKER